LPGQRVSDELAARLDKARDRVRVLSMGVELPRGSGNHVGVAR
jgi:hypothetical protein